MHTYPHIPQEGPTLIISQLGPTCAVVSKGLVSRHIGYEDRHTRGGSVNNPLDQNLGPCEGDLAPLHRLDRIGHQHGRVEDVDAGGILAGELILYGHGGAQWVSMGDVTMTSNDNRLVVVEKEDWEEESLLTLMTPKGENCRA